MKKLWAVTKNELLRYFISPLAYVYLIAFLVLNGSFAVYFGHFIERGIADLTPMFGFQPWLYLLFIPGISMRLWSEEFRNKTIVQIVTMPVSITTLVLGKFFASWIFVLIALLLTFPFWILVNYLGQPDNAVIFVSYLGSWLLAGCMLAISQTMSSLTKNQVIALVLSVVANFLFFVSGIEYVLGFFRMFTPASIVDMIASFSFLTHFGQVMSGLFEFRYMVFVISIILLFNIATILIVSFKTSGTSKWLKSNQAGYYVIIFLMMLLGFVGLNLSCNNFFRTWQYDFTEEKIYTLSPSSQKILSDIPEKITAKFYYSPILGQRNPEIRIMYDRIRLLLQRFHNLEPDKFSFRIYNPEPLTEAEDAAISSGLQPIPLIELSRNGYMGIVFSDAIDNKTIIPFFPMERQTFLEQDLMEKIYQLIHKKKVVGIISGLPIMETQQEVGYISPEWNIISEIKKFYDIKIIKKSEDFPQIDVLMLVHPQNLSDEFVNEIKRYSKQGGKTLLLLDTAAEAPRIFSAVNTEFYPSDVKDLDKFFGFRMYNELVVVDLDNSITVDATKNYSTNPIFTQDVVQFVLPNDSMNPDFDITKNLQSMLFASTSLLVPDGYNSEFTPLIVGGKNSGIMPSSVVYEGINPADLLNDFEPINKLKVIAALLKSRNSYLPFEAIVVADTDFIYDTFWSKGRTILENNYFVPVYDNANFILNALDYLSGNNDLISLRGKIHKIRVFEDFENMRKQNIRQFRLKEHDIFNKINYTKAALNEITAKRNFEEREIFTADEQALIAKTRQNLQNLLTELGDIRINMHKNLQDLSMMIKLSTIFSVPLLIIIVLIFQSILKNKQWHNFSLSFSFNKEFTKTAFGVLTFVMIGAVSVYFSTKDDWSEFENKKVFSNFVEELNNITNINLSSKNENIEFIYDNGEWKIKNSPCMVVHQERIRRFLTEIANMQYYEKKSDKLENLGAFGLNFSGKDVEDGIKIVISGEKEKFAEFYLGKYDIDIGRGGRAAYIRFPNEFQVWMVRADLIDMSIAPINWAYGSLWNLRFGRLKGFNKVDNQNRIMVLIKELLNTFYIGEEKEIQDSKKVLDIVLHTENDIDVSIDFVKKNEDIYVKYHFPKELGQSHLGYFAKTADKCYYKIDKNKFKEIENVVITAR